MKKLIIVLLVFSGSAWAGWKSIGEDSAGTFYADADSIARNGSIATMNSVLDYKSFQRMVEVGYFSQRTRVEYDCAERRFRRLDVSLHAEPMGAGKIIYSDDSIQAWEPVVAGTMTDTLWAFACK